MPRKPKRHKKFFVERSRKCFNGDIDSYVAEELKKLEEANNKALQEEERERQEFFNKFLETEAQIKKENKEAMEVLDYKRDLYLVKNTTSTKNKAYKVTFADHPEYLYVAFAETNNKAIAKAHKYIRDKFFPAVAYKDCPVDIKEGSAHRCYELDKYALEEQAPIPALLKEGINFKCSGCGKVSFNYQDYATKRCFIVEGEGDIVPFAKGMIFCYSCYHKYFD